MTVLVVGVLVWSIVHLFKAIVPNTRTSLIEKVGAKPYRGLSAIGILLGVVLIVIGWRSANVQPVYMPPLFGSIVIPMLMYVSFVLFAAASAPGNIKRWLRHPMLTGAIVWAGAHLLANGDNRSIVLFGGIGLWALVSILLISRRDGEWQRPAAVPVSRDAMTLAGSAVIFGVVVFFHATLLGVSALPGW